jgi:fructose transport system substrate-binding protein
MRTKKIILLTIFVMLLAACGGSAEPTPEPVATEAPESSPTEAPASESESEPESSDEEVIIGLITKTETNPFFVKMREGAQAKADELGATLMTASGTFDTDNESQVTAIENMINAGVKGILITPADSTAIVPTIEEAQEAGVLVIALDTPTVPEDATDALFATDNFKAGVLIGEYARAVMGDEPAKIALLGLPPGITVNELRQGGFLEGYGITADDPQIVCVEDTQGDQAKGQTAMENCLTKDPEINLVYTINEPAAFGAYTAIENAGLEDDVLLVSVDGGCAGVEGVVDGRIAATSQQYPLLMASLGVEAVVEYAQTGVAPSGYTDTGVALITNNPVEGVESEGVVFGVESCWGEPSPGALEAAQAAEAGGGEATGSDEEIIIGLITKTETNPFFVKMREGAQAKADELGVTLMTASGTFDTDNESQVTAIENMINAGVKGILITPADSTAIVPTIEEAREAGVLVIALDTPTVPEDATDALFATDNFVAGVLIGEYARAVMGDEPVKIALLGLPPGITVNELRQGGFLEGFGITADDPQIVCVEDTQGDQAKGQTAMENCLTKDPEINLVYTINEPAAFGAYTAIENAGLEDSITIVSVDGGCSGVEGVVDGRIAATSQQYPLLMAALGVETVVEYAQTGEAPSGFTDTGVNLITDNPVEGVESEDSIFGLENCWG